MLFLLSLFPAMMIGPLADEDEQNSSEEDDQVLIGTTGPDSITGNEGDDDIIGLLGDDTLSGEAGDDVLQGLNGNDWLIGGEGNDAMQGRGDNDTLQGFSGDDWVDGNDGTDLVRAGGGDDVAIGGLGEDTVDGRSGDDVVIGGELNADPLTNAELGVLRDGGTLDDIFTEETNPIADIRDDGAADQLFGSGGSDLLIMGAGDVAEGGRELDDFAVIAHAAEGDLGPATITDFNNPEGETIALYFRADETVDEDAITVTDDGEDALVSYEGEVLARVTGAAGTLTADDIGILQPEDASATPTIEGTEDADGLTGTSVADVIDGFEGDDTVEGGAGFDTINGGDGSDIIQGQAGDDRINGNADDDFLQGRGGDDSLSGNAGADWVNGNDGNDSVRGGTSADTVMGGQGEDTVVGGEGADLLVGGDLSRGAFSTNALERLQAGERLFSVAGDVPGDRLFIPQDDFEADVIDGGNRDDQIIFGTADTVTGGADNDTFFALGSAVIAETGPGVVTDYTPGEDALVIMTPFAPVINIVEDGGDALVQMNGTTVVRIEGGAGRIEASDVLLSRGLDLTTR
ncbi:calcium-binding protein [uncultured Tateyamaria sp.]|uniref:calcium-binding protein n=1 Tax=uncultured Tateyamaria sp. TaxID=455651 RepID=UPI0026187D26|nr:calcium-binding protein [uncultured Tateyamaria sp.]